MTANAISNGASAPVNAIDFIPHAIFGVPISYFSKNYGLKIESSHDDLDAYEGTYYIEGELPVAIRTYAGHPKNTVTLYLPSTLQSVEKISVLVRDVAKHFGIDDSALQWERAQDPAL